MVGLLDSDEMEELAREFEIIGVAGGLPVKDDPNDRAVHIVRSGTIELRRHISGRVVTLQLLRPGAVFGDVPNLISKERPFEAHAAEDTSLIVIPANELFALLNRRPRLALRWLQTLAARISDTQDRVGDLLSGPLDAQVASFLLRNELGTGLEISQERLAQLFGVRRTSLNQVLRTMSGRGLIELTYRRVAIVDRAGLEALLH